MAPSGAALRLNGSIDPYGGIQAAQPWAEKASRQESPVTRLPVHPMMPNISRMICRRKTIWVRLTAVDRIWDNRVNFTAEQLTVDLHDACA